MTQPLMTVHFTQCAKQVKKSSY